MSSYDALFKKVNDNEILVGVLGLGYVGLPLAVLFAKKGTKVLGFEKSEQKTTNVNNGINYIGDVEDDELKEVTANGNLQATTDFSRIAECDALLICVPTPLDRFKKPDMTYIESACKDIGTYMKDGVFISLESTTYPTTTENLMLPIIEKHSGKKHEEDFWLCFSPERVDPGNKLYKTENTPKVIGGLGEEAIQLGLAIYGKAISSLHPVSSPRVSEMVKILENTYRLVNISLVNELALLCGKMDIDIWEVIDAAKTKPFGFQAFYPGPGIGGHCIPLDPFYLEYIAKNYQFNLTMINTADNIENLMPHRMTIKINSALNRHQKPINGSKVLFIGVAYKPDIADERESPALKIMDEIAKKNGVVYYNDPYVPEVTTGEGRMFKSSELSDELVSDMDCVVFVTNHSTYDVHRIVDNASLVVDLRNATEGIDNKEKIYKL
ncbi:MAG: nucleotide sugar dehydrogenase [Spirochaetota bacterium]